MPMTLYGIGGSPPVRAVYMCMEALDLNPEHKMVNILIGEHMKPEYLKMNPQHSVPTLDDDGFILWDSHAINIYLVSKYGNSQDHPLYPNDIQQRALIHQRLFFDDGVLFPRLRDITYNLLWKKSKQITKEQVGRINEALDLMEKFLEGRDYLAGDHHTIADICCVSTVATYVGALRISVDNHPKVKAWLQRCRDNMKGFAKSQDSGIAALKQLVDAELA